MGRRDDDEPYRGGGRGGGGGGDRGDGGGDGGADGQIERREKKEKKRRRSQSSDSAQRSREREMKRRQKQQQHANKMSGRSGTPGIPDAGVGGGQRMFWDGFQWVPRADNPAATVNPNDPNVSRKMRRLYLGNLPYHLGITEDSFSKQLYDTMKDRGLCNDPNANPVLHIWFSRDKGANYGFCEMATIEEADRVLQLDGILVSGVAVSIKRPTDAQQGQAPLANAGQVPGGQGGGAMLALPPLQVQATSSVILIEQLLQVNSSTVKQDYDDVVSDMKDGCGSHGKIKKVFIVRRSHSDKAPELRAGDVYMQCVSVEDATKIMRAMGHRKYDGRQISMKSHDEHKWHNVIEPLT